MTKEQIQYNLNEMEEVLEFKMMIGNESLTLLADIQNNINIAQEYLNEGNKVKAIEQGKKAHNKMKRAGLM